MAPSYDAVFHPNSFDFSEVIPLKQLQTDKRLHVSILFILLALYAFWFGSRYPALNEKALMGMRTETSGIAFDTLIEVLPGAGLLKAVFANTINWIYTNWKGMTFGVIFGAAMLTLLGLLPKRQFKGYFSNALMGTMMGAPLGVCVNCAAPIAQGLHEAGMRRETTLAALIASPSLNVIVVTMSFALLPLHLALIKLLAMLIFLLLVLPVLVRLLDRVVPAKPTADLAPTIRKNSLLRSIGEKIHLGVHSTVAQQRYLQALRWFLRTYAENFLMLVRITVPLMLLAGFAGAMIVTVLPVETLLSHVTFFDGRMGAFLALCLIAAFALFLPVPIAFDVILVSVLYAAGWRDYFAMTALLALGTFSIYSFLIVGRAMSYRIALSMSAALFCLSIAGGIVAWGAAPYAQSFRWEQVAAILQNAKPRQTVNEAAVLPDVTADIQETPAAVPVSRSRSTNLISHTGPGRVTVSEAPLESAAAPAVGNTAFARIDGADIGLDLIHDAAALKQIEPYTYFGGIAAGDIDGDGWDEIVMGNGPETGGLSLYMNRQGRFVRQDVSLGQIDGAFVNAATLVDLDNDGALDLFVSTFMEGAYIFRNIGGQFDPKEATRLPNRDALMMGAPAFADLDRDGDLDILAANWVGAAAVGFGADRRARDRILWNNGTSFEPMELPGVPGESLSTLIMDINGDGHDDILIGDDGFHSDKAYLNTGHHSYKLLRKSDGVMPYLGQATMSLDSGDFDNDGEMEVYLSQITQAKSSERQDYCNPEMKLLHGETADCETMLLDRSKLFAATNPLLPNCMTMQDPQMRAICGMYAHIRRAGLSGASYDCGQFPAGWPVMRRLCEALLPTQILPPAEIADDNARHDPLGYRADRSLLLSKTENGAFVDLSTQTHSDRPGWSWNAKFTDLDQDGWQDIFVATGYIPLPPYASNAFYRNTGTGTFSHMSSEYGLADAIPTTSYVLMDYDRDGDVDVIRAPSTAGVIVHRNDRPDGQGLWIRLRDEVGNTSGIGSRITIETEAGTQVRIIKTSGGFVSFDPIQAHFGLGSEPSAARVTVDWPDGAQSTMAGPVQGNRELIFTRH